MVNKRWISCIFVNCTVSIVISWLNDHSLFQHLKKPQKNNLLPIPSTATASLRYGVFPAATAAIASGFLQDLIQAGILSGDHAYLACGPFKVSRARQNSMENAKIKDKSTLSNSGIIGIFFDSRKDVTRILIPDQFGQLHPRLVR